jgi:hypothetical protein
MAAYRKAAARDALEDLHGNAYVPTMMGNIDHHVPQRGQWAFCHAVYPGGVFPPSDTLVTSQLAMLRDTKAEGLVFDTGWMREGIWTYFASFYGHAMLLEGDSRAAAAGTTPLALTRRRPFGLAGPRGSSWPRSRRASTRPSAPVRRPVQRCGG